MTGMGLDDEPHITALGKTERISGGEGQLHGDFDMRVGRASYAGKNYNVAAFQGNDLPREDISRADLGGFASGQQDIARSDADTEPGSDVGAEERGLQNESAVALARWPFHRHFPSHHSAS